MRIFRIVLFLFVVAGALKLAQEPVHADACEDACLTSYNVCIMNSDTAAADCSVNADNEFFSCMSEADDNYYDCINLYGGPIPAVMSYCGYVRDMDYGACYGGYWQHLGNCDSQQAARDADCYNTYASCLNGC